MHSTVASLQTSMVKPSVTVGAILHQIALTGVPAASISRCPAPSVTALPDGRIIVTLASELISTELIQCICASFDNVTVVEV